MKDFANRVDAQRKVIDLVNGKFAQGERLFGLSEKSISRWESAQGLDKSMPLVQALRKVAALLQSLANKSQEAVTDDYESRSIEVNEQIEGIGLMLRP